jgi:toxin ParE1/3/4
LTVRWSRRALSDIAAVYAYISRENQEAAVRAADRLYAAGEGLARFPHLGRRAKLAGRRELVVNPWLLIYAVRREEVHILSVEHGARRT